MRITKWVDIEPQEVEVFVGINDMIIALSDCDGSQESYLDSISRCVVFLNRVPKEIIDQILPNKKEVILEHLEKAKMRFLNEKPST